MDRFTITYKHTTKDGFKIYLLQDMSKQEYNDGRCVIYSDLDYCEELRKKLIKESKNEQLKFEL